jgi:hypothetical protein
MKNAFGCIRKNRFRGIRHDFGVKSARKASFYGGVGTKNAGNRAAYTDEDETSANNSRVSVGGQTFFIQHITHFTQKSI